MTGPNPTAGVPANDVIQVLSQQVAQGAVDLAVMTVRATNAEATVHEQAAELADLRPAEPEEA